MLNQLKYSRTLFTYAVAYTNISESIDRAASKIHDRANVIEESKKEKKNNIEVKK